MTQVWPYHFLLPSSFLTVYVSSILAHARECRHITKLLFFFGSDQSPFPVNHVFLTREFTPDPPANAPVALPRSQTPPPNEPPNPQPPIPASLSFLLNDVEDHGQTLPFVPSEPHPFAPDTREPVNMEL